MKVLSYLILFFVISFSTQAQFTKQDTLRGSITPQRAWWDLQHYNLEVEVFPEEKSIKGVNTITYKVLESNDVMQIDLQHPMKLEKVTQNGKELSFGSYESAHYVELSKKQKVGKEYTITLHFSGKPRIARNPPWDGGYTWTKDSNGLPFITTSNQGIGSSVWWPNKDHPADEPDKGVDLIMKVPSNLVAVGNGRLISTEDFGSTKSWHWRVVNPINNYGVNVNIGDYMNLSLIHI